MKNRYAIISGEGTEGKIISVYMTPIGLKRRLTADRCGGDRWAWAAKVEAGETAANAIDRVRCIGGEIE